MKAYALKFAATALVIAGLFATIQLIGERQAENTAAISSLGDVRSLLSTYDRWKDKAQGPRTGVPRSRRRNNLRRGLGLSRGTSPRRLADRQSPWPRPQREARARGCDGPPRPLEARGVDGSA
jgi:hypothetical protein